MNCLEAVHPFPTLPPYCIHNATQRIQPEEIKKKRNTPPRPSSKKHHALDIDIYTYDNASAPPPKGVPPAPRIVKMGCHGRNHAFFFLGRCRWPLSWAWAWHGMDMGRVRTIPNPSLCGGVCVVRLGSELITALFFLVISLLPG